MGKDSRIKRARHTVAAYKKDHPRLPHVFGTPASYTAMPLLKGRRDRTYRRAGLL